MLHTTISYIAVAEVKRVFNSREREQQMRKIRDTQQEMKTITNYFTMGNYTNVLEEDMRYLADWNNFALNRPSTQVGEAESIY